MSTIELEPPRMTRSHSLNRNELSRASSRLSQPIVLDEQSDDDDTFEERPMRRRRVEVDVDDDDAVARSARTTLRSQPSPEAGAASRPILILDSDEESGNGMPRSSNVGPRSNTGRQASSSSFRIFSPSPPHQPNLGRSAPPPVIAQDLPFAILPPARNGDVDHNRPPFDEPPQNQAGPSNGGRPSLRLGGGLFSQANRRSRNTGPMPRNADTDNYNPNSGAPVDRLTRLSRVVASFIATGNPTRLMNAHSHWGNMSNGFYNLFAGVAMGRELTKDYQKPMTHPGRPPPGWVYDLGPQEGTEGQTLGDEILVCASCMAPLLANADDVPNMSEKEKRKKRVWALRCGHVLDGKCVEALLQPRVNTDEETEVIVLSEVEERPESSLKSKPKGKGKGKAAVQEVKKGAMELDDLVEELPDPRIEPVEEPISVLDGELPSDVNTILSRLRPRGPAGTPSPSRPSSTSPSRHGQQIRPVTRSHQIATQTMTQPASSGTYSTVPRRAGGTKRKRGGKKASKPDEELIEDRRRWPCPVCGQVHESIKVNGVWKMDPELGAILAFT